MSLQGVVSAVIAPNQTTPLDYTDGATREGVRDIVARLNPADPAGQAAMQTILTDRGYTSTDFATNLAAFQANDPLGKQATNPTQIAMALIGVPKVDWESEGANFTMSASDFSPQNVSDLAAAYTRINGNPPAPAVNTVAAAKPAPTPVPTPTPISTTEPGVATLDGNPPPTATAIPTGTAVQGAPLEAAQVADQLQQTYGTLGFVIGGNTDTVAKGTLLSQPPSDAKDMDTYANQTTLPGDWQVFAHLGLGGQWVSLGSWNDIQSELSQPNGQSSLYNSVASQIDDSMNKYRNFSNISG